MGKITYSINIIALALILALGLPRAKAEPQQPAQSVTQPAAGHRDLQGDLQAALLAEQAKLQGLEPWQRVIFQEEIAPRFQKFVRESKVDQVVVDSDAIRSFLIFFGPKVFEQKDPKIEISYGPDSKCIACKVLLSSPFQLEAKLKKRWARRGMIAEFQSGSASAPTQVARTPQARLTVQWSQADSEETPRFVVQLKFHTDSATQIDRSVELKKEILETDSLEGVIDDLLTDAFIELGSKGSRVSPTQAELWLSLRGANEFATYQKVKQVLQDQLIAPLFPGVQLEERKFTVDEITLALPLIKKLKDSQLEKDLKKALDHLYSTQQLQKNIQIKMKDPGQEELL